MHTQEIKTVGHNGQLYLGKDFAGQTVLIDRIDEHTVKIMMGRFKPHSEAWLTDKEMEKINKAAEWYSKNPPQDNFDDLMAKLEARIHEQD